MAEAAPGVVAPEVPVVPASTDAPGSEFTADPIIEKPDEPEAKPERTFTQKEVNEIAARRAAQAERSARKIAMAEARAEVAERQLQEVRQPKQPAEPAEPDPKDFKDFETWNKAQIAYHVKRGISEAMSGREKETAAQEQARLETQRGETLKQKFASAEAKYPDFREALGDQDLPFNGAILAYIEDSKIGGEVAYHLAQNKAEAFRIAGLSPIQQVVALSALESKLTAAPPPTRTPEPIVPSAGKASVRKDTFDLSPNNSQEWDEFVKRRRKELGRR